MRWIRFSKDGKTVYGSLTDDTISEVAGEPWSDAAPTGRTFALAEVKVEVPVIPRTFYCAGINYASHIREMAHKRGVEPVFPDKADIGYRANNALIADGEAVVIPRHAPPKVNYEGELVVVIGKQVKHLTEANAMSCVFGYTIGNDVSERTWQRGDRTFWRGKNTDTFKPMGPWIETDADLDAMETTIRVNGREDLRFKTNDMIFGIAHYIAAMTQYLTLYPGDVIWMGTDGTSPDLVDGDVVEVELTGIGVLRNPFVREKGKRLMGKLTGKVAIVTGASRGIGQQIAELFASEGAKVVCAARTLNEGDHRMLEGSLSRTVALIREKGGVATGVTADVSIEAECVALVHAARDAYGPIDILVNNAALNYYLPTETYPTNRWVRCFAINVHAPFILAKEVLADMIPRRTGAIVNISSGAAIGPGRGPYEDKTVRGGVMYGATKAALERFTQGLAQEVAQYEGISVAAVSPSQVVPTPGTIHHKLVTGIDDPKGEPPIMMARAALLLASEPALKVNGRVTYSQQILKEFGWIEEATGRGVTTQGSGYSLI